MLSQGPNCTHLATLASIEFIASLIKVKYYLHSVQRLSTKLIVAKEGFDSTISRLEQSFEIFKRDVGGLWERHDTR